MNKYEKAINKISMATSSSLNVDVETLWELVDIFKRLPSKSVIQSAIIVLNILPVNDDKVCLKALNDIIKLSNIIYGG